MTGPVVLTMPATTLQVLADGTHTPLPWRDPRPPGVHQAVPRLLADALATFARPQVLVTLDVLHAAGRLRSWQRLAGRRVTSLTAAGTELVELAWFGAEEWRAHLVRTVTMPGVAAPPVRAVVAARTHGRNRVGWVAGPLAPATLADRVSRLARGALS